MRVVGSFKFALLGTYFSGREFRKPKNRSGEAWSDFPPDLLTLLLLDTVPVGR